MSINECICNPDTHYYAVVDSFMQIQIRNIVYRCIYVTFATIFERELKAHCYAEKHKQTNGIVCAECGKTFKGASRSGIHYHRSLIYMIN
jgi:hypothetical protein